MDDSNVSEERLVGIYDAIHRLYSKASIDEFDVSMSTASLFQEVQKIYPGEYEPELVAQVLMEEGFQLKLFADYGPEWLFKVK